MWGFPYWQDEVIALTIRKNILIKRTSVVGRGKGSHTSSWSYSAWISGSEHGCRSCESLWQPSLHYGHNFSKLLPLYKDEVLYKCIYEAKQWIADSYGIKLYIQSAQITEPDFQFSICFKWVASYRFGINLMRVHSKQFHILDWF